jgi:hypothetical protein
MPVSGDCTGEVGVRVIFILPVKTFITKISLTSNINPSELIRAI